MAGKFGKREKIITGVIIAIAAIAVIHLYGGFSKVATEDAAIDEKLTTAQQTWDGMKNIPTGEALTAYLSSIDRDAKEFWSVIIPADLLKEGFYNLFPEPAKPNEPGSVDESMDGMSTEENSTYNPEMMNYGGESMTGTNPRGPIQHPTPLPPREEAVTATDAEDYAIKFAEYEKKVDFYNTITDMNTAIAEALLLTRLERLAEMQKTYAAGQTWIGDGAALQNQMELSFLQKGKLQGKFKYEVGWNIPLQLHAMPPQLWTEIESLYSSSKAFQLTEITDASIYPTQADLSQAIFNNNTALNNYNQECVKWGLIKDKFKLDTMKSYNGFYVPELAKLHLVNLIIKQAPDGTRTVGGQIPLTKKLLKEAFDVQMPRLDFMFFLNRQMSQIEQLLVLARKNGIEEVNSVRLFEYSNTLAIDEVAIQGEQAVNRVRTSAPRGGGFTVPGAGTSDDNLYGASDGGAGTTMQLPPGYKPYTGKSVPTGEATRVNISFIATNENTFKYLYDIVRAPQLFKIEDLIFDSLPGKKLQVYVTVECSVTIIGLSQAADGLMEQDEPVNLMGEGAVNHGKMALEAKRAEEKKRGWDKKAIIDKAIEPYKTFLDSLKTTETATTENGLEGDASLTSESLLTTGTL